VGLGSLLTHACPPSYAAAHALPSCAAQCEEGNDGYLLTSCPRKRGTHLRSLVRLSSKLGTLWLAPVDACERNTASLPSLALLGTGISQTTPRSSPSLRCLRNHIARNRSAPRALSPFIRRDSPLYPHGSPKTLSRRRGSLGEPPAVTPFILSGGPPAISSSL
jgi:hypothetical protein